MVHRTILLFLMSLGSSLAETTLFGEGPALKAAHDYLFDAFIKDRECEWKNLGKDVRTLFTVPVWSGTLEVEGQADLELDLGTEQVTHMFRYFEISGSGLTNIAEVALQSFQPDVGLNRSTRQDAVLRVKTPGLSVPTADTPRSVLRFKGTGRIESIRLKAFSRGIPETFDDLSYRNLGHDQAVEPVTFSVHPHRERSIEGHVAIDRSKWFRYYGTPNASPRGVRFLNSNPRS